MGAVIAALWAIALIVKPLAGPLIWASLLAFLLQPAQRALTRKLRGRTTAAAAILTGLTPLAIFLPLALIGIAFAQQVGALADNLQRNPQFFDLATWLDPVRHPRIAGAVTWVTDSFNIDTGALRQFLLNNLQRWAGRIASSSGQLFLNIAGLLLKFFLMLFILFFMLRDGAKLFERIASLLPLAQDRRDLLFARLGKVTRAVVYGCGVTAMVQGTLVGIGFAIAGLTGPVVFGVIATVSALLPFGGAALIWVPALLYFLAGGKIGWAIFMGVWGGLISVSDNFVRPAIISRYTPVPTLLVFIGVIGGISAFGLIGFIAGPVILVLATELFKFAEGSLARQDI